MLDMLGVRTPPPLSPSSAAAGTLGCAQAPVQAHSGAASQVSGNFIGLHCVAKVIDNISLGHLISVRAP